jgi:hypothetical protein
MSKKVTVQMLSNCQYRQTGPKWLLKPNNILVFIKNGLKLNRSYDPIQFQSLLKNLVFISKIVIILGTSTLKKWLFHPPRCHQSSTWTTDGSCLPKQMNRTLGTIGGLKSRFYMNSFQQFFKRISNSTLQLAFCTFTFAYYVSAAPLTFEIFM